MDSTNTLPQVSTTAILREALINALFANASGSLMFGRDPTSAGLTFGYLGGRFGGTLKAGGTVVATDNTTNYVVVEKSTLAVTISTATTNWNNTTTYGRAWLLTASSGTLTYEDHRNGTNGILSSLTGSGGSSAGIAINAQTGTTYTVLVGDLGKFVTHSNGSAIAVTLPQATGSFTTPFFYYTKNLGAGTVTITPTTSTIGGAATLVLTTGQCALIVSDGTNYQTAFTHIAGVSLSAANVWTKNQSVPYSELTDGANIAVDASLSNNFHVVLGGNRTLDNPSNLADGMILNFYIEQDGTGTRTLAKGSKYKFPGGISTLSTAASARDLFSCIYNATDDVLLCNLSKAYS